MITGIVVHSSVRRYHMPIQFGIADHEIGYPNDGVRSG